MYKHIDKPYVFLCVYIYKHIDLSRPVPAPSLGECILPIENSFLEPENSFLETSACPER